MDIAILIVLILLNGIFAMSEIALITSCKNCLQRLADEPTLFLSTVQIGITAIGILNCIVGEAELAGPLVKPPPQDLDWSRTAAPLLQPPLSLWA